MIQMWKEHFKNLLGNSPKITDKPITKIIYNHLYIKLGQFTQELNVILTKMKNSLDVILPVVWKTKKFDDLLLQFCNTIYNQNTIEKWKKACIFPFPKEADLKTFKNYWGITLTSIMAKVYNALLLNCIKQLRKFFKKSKQFSEKSIPNITDSDSTLNHKRSFCKKTQGDTLVGRFLQSIWFYIQRKDGANTSSLRCLQRNCHSHNDALLLHKNKDSLIGWRHRLLWHCCWSSAKGYISTISVHNLPRLHTLNINDFTLKKGKKQMIPRTNYYGCRLHRWHSTSCKYTYSSWNSAA